MTSSNLTSNQKRLIELAYTRSCLRLDAQQEIANASDQRSLVFATIAVASAALIFSGLGSQGQRGYATGSALFLGLSAITSALAALPQKHYSTGSHAKDLNDFVSQDVDETKVLRGLCVNNDKDIDFNEKSASVRAHFYKFSIFVFILGISVAVIGFLSADSLSTG